MENVCNKCGKYSPTLKLTDDKTSTICPFCNHIEKIHKRNLFIITGASGVGKSSLSKILYEKEKDYIVLESDILWHNEFNTPEDNYRQYRETWLRLCKNISKIGLPVVLCGCVTPEQFTNCDQAIFFNKIHYTAIISEDEKLKNRLEIGREIHDNKFINDSINFNNWLKENADKTDPTITLLDNSNLSKTESANLVNTWIMNIINEENNK